MERAPKLTKNLETCFCFHKHESRGHPKHVRYLRRCQEGGHPRRLCESSARPALRSGEGSSVGNPGQAGSDPLAPRPGSHLPSGTGTSVLKRERAGTIICVTISVHHTGKLNPLTDYSEPEKH